MLKNIMMAIGLLSLTGCASLFSESSYPVNVSSTSENVKFNIKDNSGRIVYSGVTPATINLDAESGFFEKGEYTIEFTMQNGEVRQHRVKSKVDGVYFVNILFWPGFFIDAASGAMWKLPANAFIDTHTKSKQNTVQIRDVNSLTPEQRKQLVPVKAADLEVPLW